MRSICEGAGLVLLRTRKTPDSFYETRGMSRCFNPSEDCADHVLLIYG